MQNKAIKRIEVQFNGTWHALVEISAKVKNGVADWSKVKAKQLKDPNAQWPPAPLPYRTVDVQ